MNNLRISERLSFFSIIAVTVIVVFLPIIANAQEETTAATTTSEVSEKENSKELASVTTDPRELGYTVERIPNPDDVLGDFVVGPGKFDLQIAPGESETIELSITNRTGVERLFKFSTEDTTGTRDGKSAVVLLGADRGPYSLRDYLDIPKQGVVIKHGERVRLPVKVSIPPDAEPGGLYGSVIVETVTLSRKEAQESGSLAQSPIVSRIGSLFFVAVEGDVERGGKLQSFEAVPNKTVFTSGPINFALVYENTGSIHATPYGELEILNYAGESVGFVELEPWFAMPKSLRFREVTWDRELLLGKYTAVARINRGYDNIVDEEQLTFWVLPWQIVATVFGAIFIVFFIFRFFVRNFEFKRK